MYIKLSSEIRLHYTDIGSGKPLLMLHGVGPGASSVSAFYANYRQFEATGYRVLMPDLPGYGRSDKPSEVIYTTAYYRDIVIEFLSALNIEQCLLVGSSLGGGIAIEIAAHAPDLVQKLVVVSPAAIEDEDVYFNMPVVRSISAFFNANPPDKESLRKLFEKMVYDSDVISTDLVDERFAILELQPPESFSNISIENIAAKIKEIICPTLVFWGIHDGLCPPSGALTLAEFCRRCQVILLSACGHWPMIEYADLFNREVLEFLGDEQGSPPSFTYPIDGHS